MNNREKENNQYRKFESLSSYNEELSSVFPIPYCRVNFLGRIYEVNKAFLELSGYDNFECIGTEIQDMFLEKKEMEDLVEKIKTGEEKKKKDLTFLTKNEDPIPVKAWGVKLEKEGQLKGIVFAFTEDWEKRKIKREMKAKLEEKTEKLQEKARQMEDSRSALLNILEDVDQSYKRAERERMKTAAIIENYIDGMFFFSSDNSLNIVNPKAEEFFDIKSRDVKGRTLSDLVTFPTLKPLIKLITDDGKKIKDIFKEELQLGKEIYLEVSTTNIKEGEESLGTLVHVHDISREKRIERIKSEFVSVAAHQLRTPLSGIKWTLGMFLEESSEKKEKLDEEEKYLIEKAYESNERMVSLVNDLLNVSRIEEGRYVYEPQKTDILEVVKPIAEEYEKIIKKKDNLEFKFNKVKEEFPKVEIDTEKIGIVIQNFLDNAIKYTNEGEIILTVSMPDEENIRVSVQDSGVGIPEEQQGRLFDKFFRAENVAAKDVRGSGLGLFISKNIVEAHGGEIDFESTEGEGSIFYFTLPLERRKNED